MKNILLVLTLLCSPLLAQTDSKPATPSRPSLKPYFSEYRGNGWIVYFSGNIPPEAEGDVKILQNQYLEAFNHQEKRSSEWELTKLGIKITVVPDNEHIPSEQTYPYKHPPHHLFHPPQ